MKKLVLVFAALTFLPFSVSATSVFNDSDSFVVAKAVKLGRSKSAGLTGGASIKGDSKIDSDKKCDVNCTKCDTATGTCLLCKTNFFISKGKCKTCPSDATCNGVDFVCDQGHYRSGEQCPGICSKVSCHSGFKTLAQPNSCCCVPEPSCDTGSFYHSEGYGCVQCGKYYGGACLECTKTGCTKCQDGYTIQDGKCVKAENCSEGYFYHSEKYGCQACGKMFGGNCLSCTASGCSSCLYSYVVKDGQCVQDISCPSVCKTCSSSNVCTSCISGYKLAGKSCVTCPSGQHYVTDINGLNGSCKKVGSLAFGAASSDSEQCASGWAIPSGNDGIQGSHCGKVGSNIAF